VKIEEVGLCRIYNTDQSGFNLEIYSGRTLANVGQKVVFGEAQAINSLTNSYTIQPIVSADGRLLPVLLVCLQEKTGEFGPIVKNTMFKSNNLYITCSKSGKLTKKIVKEWLDQVYFPNVQDESVLLVDSWGCQNERFLLNAIPAGKK